MKGKYFVGSVETFATTPQQLLDITFRVIDKIKVKTSTTASYHTVYSPAYVIVNKADDKTHIILASEIVSCTCDNQF